MVRGPLAADDHAFADGPVFQEVRSQSEAEAQLASVGLTHEPEAARRLLSIWQQFRSGAEIGQGVRLGLGARLINAGDNKQVVLEGPSAIRGVLRAEAGGAIQIGRFCYIGDDVIISARERISVGEATLLAHGVQIFDNDSHPINAHQREVQFRRMLGDKSVTAPLEIGSAPVEIGARCWVGLGSVILKGVKIGTEAIVAAQSVVTSSLEGGILAAGNPARAVRGLTT